MSAPLAESATQDLLELLGLVDDSRARSLALEEQFRADIATLYAERLLALTAERAQDEAAEALNAPFLAALVLLIRRALSAGAEEGGRFATAQFAALGLPAVLLDEIEIPLSPIGDKLVRDFLEGQVAVVRLNGGLDEMFAELLKRGQLAVVSAVQSGRGVATEAALAAVAALVETPLHKLWVARFDLETPPCKMCVRLHGQHVPLGEAFTALASEPAPYAGSLSAPPRHPNCRCSLVLYVPGSLEIAAEGVTPLSMQAYASWALSLSEQDRSEYIAATVVHVKAYTRMVDGKLQQVSGYYYDIQTGQKIPEGQWGSAGNVKEVSAQQARQITAKSKAANKATPKGGDPDLSWKPGTYRLDVPGADDDTQVVVHQDGSSTSIHKGQVAEADKAQTAQFLAMYQQHGLVQKISDDPEVPDRAGPGPQLEPGDEDKKNATLADGHYVFPNHPTYGGVHVKPDGSGELFFKDFKTKLPLKEVAVRQIAQGNLGEFEEVDEKDFTEDWQKQFKESKAGGAKAPRQQGAPTPQGSGAQARDNAAPGVNVPGVATRAGGAQQAAPRAAQQGSANVPGQAEEPGDRTDLPPGTGGAPDFASIPDVNLPGEPPLLPNQTGAGIVVVEPDGSIWIYEPKDHFAGYQNTFPKGGLEDGLTAQQNAHKELWEETGITADITGYLGDYRHGKVGAGRVRMYVATRKGGEPKPDDPSPYVEGGNEAAAVKNVSPEEAAKLLNVNRDKRILKDLNQFGTQGRPPAQPGDQTPAWMQGAPNQQNVPGQQGAPNAPQGAPSAPRGGVDTTQLRQELNEQRATGRTRTLDEALDDVARPANAGRSPGDSVSSEEQAQREIPEAPDGGPGAVVKGGPSLFPVGKHSVQVEEGSQVYRSSKSKDTLYVLQPNGDLIKYNPQGAGVQATKVGSSENPAARAQQLAKLDNVTDELGVSIKNTMPPPGTGKALVGGFEMTSKQLDDAIAALSSNPSGNVAADLKKVGSPLAAGKFHEVAAPYKAYYNNKTKPALIAALKKAQALTGSTPDAAAPAVAHLAEAHGLEEHHSSLGHADTEAIHAALHAVDPRGSDHSHANDGPGFISIAGAPFPPATVAHAIDALKKSPTKETGVKKPLKAAGSPLANLDLQSLANNSEITKQYKGSNGKVHYGKLKPAVIALLTDALDKHQTKNPPTPLSAPEPPPPTKFVGGMPATQAQIKEMQDFFSSIDFDSEQDAYSLLNQMSHNPMAFGVDWDEFLEQEYGGLVPDNEINKVLFDSLNKYLDRKTPAGVPQPLPPKPEDTSPELKIGAKNGTVNQLIAYKNALDSSTGFGSLSGKLPEDNAFAGLTPDAMGAFYGIPDVLDFPQFKQVLSGELQKKIDQALLKKTLPPPTPANVPPSTISVGGAQVTKADLLAAVEAVKNSPSTGVKGPLKAIDSPLSKVDVKSYIESDPLSDPYKGSNGKVHYGKLKDAVAAVLQAKADQMGDPELPADPAVTPAGDAAPEVDTPSVAPAVPSAPDAPSQPAPRPSFQSVDPVDDFFSDGVPTTPSSGEQTPAQKLKQALENAEASEDVPPLDNGFPAAFQAAVKEGKTYFTDEDAWSDSESDFEGGWYYEITSNGTVYEIDESGNDVKKLSDQQVLNLLNGSFDQVGGSLEEATAEADLPEAGFYTSSAAGLSIKVYADGSGLVTNLSSGEQVNVDTPSHVKAMLDSGGWTKVSDSPDEIGKAHIEGVEVGHYPGGTQGGISATVYPNGTVLVSSEYGDAVMDVKTAKPYLLAKGTAPQAIPTDPPDWVANVPKGPGGLGQGEYDAGFGEKFNVTDSAVNDVTYGGVLSADFIAALLFSGDATYKPGTAPSLPDSAGDADPDAAGPDLGVPGGPAPDVAASPEQGSKLAALVAKAKAAADLDDGVSGISSNLSKAFQKSAKTGDTYYSSPNGVFTSPPSTAYVKATPDGIITVHSSDGGLLGEWTEDDILQALDRVFEGPAVQDPVPPPPSSADEINTSGVWEGHPVGTYTNGEGHFLDITPDGPELSFDDIQDGLDPDAVLDMIESGDLTFVPPLDSPAPSTPSQHVDPDMPKLQPFMVAGYTNMGWTDKPVLLAAAKQWAKEAGLEGVAAQHLTGATKKEDLIDWLNHWAKGEWDKAYEIEAKKVKNHKTKATHPGSPDNPANAGGFTKKKMPPLVEGELPAGVVPPGAWPANGQNTYAWDDDQVDAYILAANMQNPTGLHNGQKKKWVVAHFTGDKIGTDSLSYLGQKNVGEGQHYSSPILPPVDKYAPGQAVPLPSDFPEIDHSKSSVQGWTNQQLDQYLNHVGPTKKVVDFLAKQKPETKAALVSLHAVSAAPAGTTSFKDPAVAKKQFEDLLAKVSEVASWNEEETTSFIHDVLKVSGKTFTKNKEQPPLGGGSSSTITQVTDEQGKQFLHKSYPEKFRVDVEHAGHELAQLAGIKVADSLVGTFEGKYGQFQAKVPSQGTLQGVAPTDLPLSALKDLMAAHVQDWVTSNDDAHSDNFLLSPDGKNVVPIDIARSFARFGNPSGMKLKVGQLSDWTTPFYDKVYKAALAKKLSDADVDELYRASIAQAKRTANVDDAAWAEVINRGLKDRTNWGPTSAKNLQELTQQALARKNAAPEDFEKFWDGIYSQLGREKPQPATTVSEGVYSGVTPEYLKHVEALGNHGAATFFSGTALEEGFLLGQVFDKPDGSAQELHLSGQLLKDADKKLTAWMKAHVSAELSGATTSPNSKKAQLLSSLDVSHFPTVVVSAAKTISHHHKQGDQDYNTSHMANFESMKTEVAQKIAAADAGNFPSAIKDWPEAQTEYKNLLAFYDAQLIKVQNMKDMGGQSKIGDYPEYDFQMPPEPVLAAPIDLGEGLKVVKMSSYYETAELDNNGKLKLTGQTASTGQTGKTYQVELSDGTQIEYRSWAQADSVARAQQGHLRIKVRNYDGTTAGADAARAALSRMGLDLGDATEEDMELLYYRHLYGVMRDRKDRDTGAMKEVTDYVSANLPGGAGGTPALSAKEELERWREGWSRLDKAKFNTFLAGKKWMPRFHRANPVARGQGMRGGQPYWERFDVDDDHLRNLPLLQHALSDPGIAGTLVKSGGLLSTEQRTQILGKWLGGMSSGSDQHHGSSNFVFTRQNQTGSYAQVLIAPEVLKRTTNYAFNSDNFGEMDNKKSGAYFDLKKMSSLSGSGNELMIKRMVSLMDDIEMIVFQSAAQRQEAIDWLKSHGVTTIRGLSIEDRLVLQQDREKALKKIMEHRKNWKGGEEAPDGTGTANVG